MSTTNTEYKIKFNIKGTTDNLFEIMMPYVPRENEMIFLGKQQECYTVFRVAYIEDLKKIIVVIEPFVKKKWYQF